MKIAIHHRVGSFSEQWITYCKEHNIPYKVVNAYDNDIVTQITKDCTVFMWHHSHDNYKDILFAKQLLFSLQMAGVKTFPDFNTGWHFDDKVGQKYMFEAIGAPLVPSYVFYSEKEAKDWAKHTSFPKVFKLRGGAGASNVYLLHSKKEANRMIYKAFHSGFKIYNKWRNFQEILKKWLQHKKTFSKLCKGFIRLFFPQEIVRMRGKEKGYVYFQDFIPKNEFDTRVVVIGNKAVAEKRFCRKGDFRASGSGNFSYDNINLEVIKCAFETSKKLKVQCAAYDFILKEDKPLIVEISYGFGTHGINHVYGYWDDKINFHKGSFISQNWIVDELIK